MSREAAVSMLEMAVGHVGIDRLRLCVKDCSRGFTTALVDSVNCLLAVGIVKPVKHVLKVMHKNVFGAAYGLCCNRCTCPVRQQMSVCCGPVYKSRVDASRSRHPCCMKPQSNIQVSTHTELDDLHQRKVEEQAISPERVSTGLQQQPRS
jgi:hypothetical protein